MSERIFNLREVSELLGVPRHVLRYWETEFPALSPEHDDGQVIYRERDVEVAARLRDLLYGEQSTISAARARIADEYQ